MDGVKVDGHEAHQRENELTASLVGEAVRRFFQ